MDLISKERTSSLDLIQLAHDMKINNFTICVRRELPKVLKAKQYENIIMNLGDYGEGTHWCALNVPKKLYFDSFAVPPPIVVPSDYKFQSTKEIQPISSGLCGQFCLLWLHYVNSHTDPSDFYKSFKDLY